MTPPQSDAVTRAVTDSMPEAVATDMATATGTDDLTDGGAARRMAGRVGIAAWTFIGVVSIQQR